MTKSPCKLTLNLTVDMEGKIEHCVLRTRGPERMNKNAF